ncbi:MAG: multiheme c-type cytochrome [Gammaproteobacteria bacterium]|nr:multiheme c-type cytochrome [Gammaproteobacteria bacterium]
MNHTNTPEVVGPALRKLLVAVLVLFALLVVNSIYLGAVSLLQWFEGESLEGPLYQSMFLVHLALGLAITLPVIVYAVLHLRRAIHRPNRLAIRLGLTLFAIVLLLIGTGFALTRGIPLVELRGAEARSIAYWLHVAAPFAACWLFVLHRLAGPRIRWTAGGAIASVGIVVGLAGVWLARPAAIETDHAAADFSPSLAKTATGHFIPPETLMQDDYCARCHADIHAQWRHSAHRLASFNNPAYLFSVRNTRRMVLARDGDVSAARFCAGCHDPVPLFSGAFDDPEFDDVGDPTAHAGITCLACHAIESVGSPRGNADYVIGVPQHYPFAFSDNAVLQWINGLSIKSNPDLHKRSFLKPLHKTAEFCGTCHKVHLPEALNAYKWLRGQNHYDSFLLSGVSGHGAQSFYYPARAEPNCNDCHMQPVASEDFAADFDPALGAPAIRGHQFPAANTAVPALLGWPEKVVDAHRAMLGGALRIDVFAIRAGPDIEGEPIAPLRPEVPALTPGATYVFDVVIRTLRLGHLFTEGTSDSNEVWLDVTVTSGSEVIGRSGARDHDGAVDPWSHFVNAYVLDRNGNRIDRRNAEEIFTRLYDHQIPPGAAATAHYRVTVPENAVAPVEVTVALRYRKFDTTYMRAFQGEDFLGNDLPIVTIAEDSLVFPVGGAPAASPPPDIPGWERWNDYGIGLLAKPDRGTLRQAENAFRRVAALDRPEGDLNLARVMIREGRLDEAADSLRRAATNGAYPWSVAWFGGLVDMQNGEFDAAIASFTDLVDTRFEEARRRGFDFSRDYRVQNALAQALFERAKTAPTRDEEERLLRLAADRHEAALSEDPENVAAHYGLAQVHARLGDEETANRHRTLHATYRLDDNARDRAITAARRRDPAANFAADAVVVYDLQRDGSDP